YSALCELIPYFLQQLLSPGRWWRLDRVSRRRPLQAVDALHEHEQHQGDDHELENRLDERAVLEQHGLAGRVNADVPAEVAEVHPADDEAQRRHDHIAH